MCAKERCLSKTDDHSLATFVFSSSFLLPVPPAVRNSLSFFERARLLLRVFRGYDVYYQTQNGELASYCFLKRNYLGKYAFLKKKDVLINPYYVVPAFRGRGVGGKLIRIAVEDRATAWETVYAVVKEENTPSIRTLEKLGFEKCGYSDKRGWSHKLTDRKTELPVFCLTRTEKQEKTV